MNNKLSRRAFLGGTTTAIATATTMVRTVAAHSVGTPVYTTADLTLRDGPGLGYNATVTVPQGTGGTIIDGPVLADGYTWWKYRFNHDDCVVGWGTETGTADADFAYPAAGQISKGWYDSDGTGYHEAVDIANDTGTNVYAGRGGYHTQNYASGCGNYSVIDHGSGWETYYCHLDSWVAGHGVNVSGCQHVAEMGSTGDAFSPHVHYEIRHNGNQAVIPGETGDPICGCTGVPKNYIDEDDSGGIL